MATVRAVSNIRTNGGLLIAERGRFGVALLNYRATPRYYGRIPVRWNGRPKKIYWMQKSDIAFVKPVMDPDAYVAHAPETELLQYPVLPAPPDKTDYNFGRTLRTFRESMQLRQHQFAARLKETGLHISQTTISYWERCSEPPRGRYLNKIAQILGMPAFVLLINFDDCAWLSEARRYLMQLTQKLCEEDPA